jgi:N-ethylmaleimide reductase
MTARTIDPLFTPLVAGALHLPNRVVMAPLTRNRAHPDGTPGAMAATYYRQRASAGLIVSEATQVSAMGKGYKDTPGIHEDAHVEG